MALRPPADLEQEMNIDRWDREKIIEALKANDCTESSQPTIGNHTRAKNSYDAFVDDMARAPRPRRRGRSTRFKVIGTYLNDFGVTDLMDMSFVIGQFTPLHTRELFLLMSPIKLVLMPLQAAVRATMSDHMTKATMTTDGVKSAT